jgi:hypothetical protein
MADDGARNSSSSSSSSSGLRLSMWSGPRNVSTALMYSFRRRADTKVVDEPLYGHYLKTSGAAHPGRETVIEAMDSNGPRVVREELLKSCDEGRVRFFKNMAHHLRGLPDESFLNRLTNVLLTRDPREMLPSLAQQLPHPTLRDTGLEEQGALLERVLEAGRTPLVLSARELLLDPEGVLRQLCERLNLPFDPAMLYWPAGPKPEDGVWAEHWYDSVHTSTGFRPYEPKTAAFPEHLRPLLRECEPLYRCLREHVIRAPGR